MKATKFFLMAVLAISILSCKKDVIDSYPDELSSAKTSLLASFDSLNADLADAASELALDLSDQAKTRAKMLYLYNRSTFSLEFSYVSPEGIMQIIEPSEFYPQEGFDISEQDHIVKTFSTKEPVLSNVFFAVEGFYAAVDIYPIVNDGQVLGGVTSLFFPEIILGRIMEPLLENQDFELWVMEKGGTIIYNQDVEEIGLNIFTDPLYEPFPEIITAAEKIAAEDHGETTYSFYQTGTDVEVVKQTYWITCKINDNEWKLIWVKPIS